MGEVLQTVTEPNSNNGLAGTKLKLLRYQSDLFDYSPSATHFKKVNLIAPERAEALGLAAESPVFTSPVECKMNDCDCGVVYKPIVYQAGYIIPADHFHSDRRGGGIYYHQTLGNSLTEFLQVSKLSYYENGCWWLEVQPLGKSVIAEDLSRSEAVKVLRVQALCFHQECHQKEIITGFILETGVTLGSYLYPICDLKHFDSEEKVRFTFSINEEGFCFFKSVEMDRIDRNNKIKL